MIDSAVDHSQMERIEDLSHEEAWWLESRIQKPERMERGVPVLGRQGMKRNGDLVVPSGLWLVTMFDGSEEVASQDGVYPRCLEEIDERRRIYD